MTKTIPCLNTGEAAVLAHMLLERNLQIQKNTTIAPQLKAAILALEEIINNYSETVYCEAAQSGAVDLIKHVFKVK